MWGNIGNDISLFLCYERADESSVQWFVILKRWFRCPWFVWRILSFVFCMAFYCGRWFLVAFSFELWFLRGGGGALFRMCRYICCGLIWVFRVQFVAAVSAKSVWYLGRCGWNLEIVCLIEATGCFLTEQLLLGFRMNFHISARVPPDASYMAEKW